MRHPTWLGLLAGVALALPHPAPAQTSPMSTQSAPLPFPGELTRTAFKDGDYLTPVLEMERRRDEYRRSELWADTYAQLLATQLSFAGENAAALAEDDQRAAPAPAAAGAAALPAGLRAHDAVEVVARAARTHQAVFVNEAHHVPRHRAFTLALLKPLYDQGFRYLAVEGATERDTALATRGYPLFRKSGLYVNEPVFGELIRAALALGYRVVPYDLLTPVQPRAGDATWAANERERIQAQNIVDRILTADPHARILVHAGYDHVLESGSDGVTPMAAQFHRISGIDPFTVDQVAMMEHSSPAYESPFYRAAVDAGQVTRSTIFEDGQGRPFSGGVAVDATVFHPRERRVSGRPDWLAMGGRRAYPVRGVANDRPVLVQAFHAREGADAVPADQLVLRAPGGDPVLMLAPGRYLVRVVAPGGRVLKQEEVEASTRGAPLTLH